MISRKDLEIQNLRREILELTDMADDLVKSIENAHWENVNRFKMPTDHMKRACMVYKKRGRFLVGGLK